jgi:hypothetical protein
LKEGYGRSLDGLEKFETLGDGVKGIEFNRF